MVSYADFMTLLLAFFVVMYSVSQLNEERYRVVTKTLEEAFNVPPTAVDPIPLEDPVTAQMPGVVVDVPDAPEQQPTSGRVEEEEQKATTSEPQLPEEFRRISEDVQQRFSELIAQGLVSVQGNEEWLEIELKSSLLFASGQAEAGRDADPIIASLAETVSNSELPIRVEGFTDDRPIASDVFPSNWELSAARATSIVKMLQDEGIAPTRLAAIGYGEFQPVAGNETEEGRAANRRVVLMISRGARLRPQIDRKPPGEARAAETREARPVVEVPLEGGGLLFTSDPSRAREDAPAQTPATAAPAPQERR